jgi:hypothetical protein
MMFGISSLGAITRYSAPCLSRNRQIWTAAWRVSPGGFGLGQRMNPRKKSTSTSRSFSIRCNSSALGACMSRSPSGLPVKRSRSLWDGCAADKPRKAFPILP